jgi:hypothetical protein
MNINPVNIHARLEKVGCLESKIRSGIVNSGQQVGEFLINYPFAILQKCKNAKMQKCNHRRDSGLNIIALQNWPAASANARQDASIRRSAATQDER